MIEQTFAILKPDAFEQNLFPEIQEILEVNGFKLVKQSFQYATPRLLAKHYEHIKDKPFFEDLVAYMTRKPVLALVLEKDNAIEDLRALTGDTDPRTADPNSLRGKYGYVDKDRFENVIHASDSLEAAQREIKLWGLS